MVISLIILLLNIQILYNIFFSYINKRDVKNIRDYLNLSKKKLTYFDMSEKTDENEMEFVKTKRERFLYLIFKNYY